MTTRDITLPGHHSRIGLQHVVVDRSPQKLLAMPATVETIYCFRKTCHAQNCFSILRGGLLAACRLRERAVRSEAALQRLPAGRGVVLPRPLRGVRHAGQPDLRGQLHGLDSAGEQYRSYPKSLLMRQVSVDARGMGNRAEQFKVVTT